MTSNKTSDMKEYNKKYYEINKDKYQEKIICECGEEYSKYKKSTHEKTQKHKNKMMEIELKKLKTIQNKEILITLEKKHEEIYKSLESFDKLKKELKDIF